MRLRPFAKAHILDRESWPELQAGLRGPESYDELGVLNRKQRDGLVLLARLGEAEPEKPFVEEVACCIVGRRLRKRRRAQESPAAVVLAMREIIGMEEAHVHEMQERYGIGGLKPPLPTAEWFEDAREKLRHKERLVEGHRPRSIDPDLSYHALALQRIAAAHSNYLANDREAMRRWLAEALIVSGERPVGKNARAAYFEQLMPKQ
jgi:hypothetical protein